jgi:cell wall assembly regulator SMI1
MKRTWKRIERWLAEQAPDILASLRPGASDEEIRRAEAEFGCIFPKAVLESYAIHNGSETCALLEYWDFYSLLGQVIRWVHDDSIREVVAPTFAGWLGQLADGLEAGTYKVDHEGVLVRIGGPEDVNPNCR